jgi:hypothetical protein
VDGVINDIRRRNPGADTMVSTVNAAGMTDRGRELMLGLMRAGMLVDSEHLSFRTKADLFDLARRFDYPVMSSHTDVGALSFRPSTWPADGRAPNAWGQLDDAGRWAAYGTSSQQFLASEFQAIDRDMDAIRDSGGTIGLFTYPYRKSAYAGGWRAEGASGHVRNNADGTSKTWAQTFLYAAERMNGRGVALASDRAGIDQIGPRFGPYAAWPLSEENYDRARTDIRGRQRYEQGVALGGGPRSGLVDKGVRYDVPIRSFHPWLYEFGDIDIVEEDAWKAMAFITAFPTIDPASGAYASLPDPGTVPPDRPQKVPASSQPGHWGRIESFVRGWHAASERELHFGAGDSSAEAAVFWILHNGHPLCSLTTFSADDMRWCDVGGRPDAGVVTRIYDSTRLVHDGWTSMTGDNAPLRRLVTGTRYWDFNLDGMGNYGMIPDFLQDVRNVGVNARQMDVLFASAEDYIEMWERAEAAKSRVPVL